MNALSDLMNPARWLLDYVRGGSANKTVITEQILLGQPAIRYAVAKICNHVATLPIDCYREVNGVKAKDKTHPGHRLLRSKPNRLQRPNVFKRMIQRHALLKGNGRAAIIRNGAGRPVELLPMMPDKTATCLWEGEKYHICQPMVHDRTRLFCELNSNNTVVLHDDDVFHIMGFGDGIVGWSIMQQARDTFAIGVESTRREVKSMTDGFAGRIMLEAPEGALRDEDEAVEFLEGYRKDHKAGGNDVGLLREGVKANVLAMSNKDAQFMQSRKFNRQDVGLLFGVESMIGESQGYNSLEQKSLEFLSSTMDAVFTSWEEEADAKLLTSTEQETRYFKTNVAKMLRTDTATTMTTLGAAVASTLFNRNEARAKLDMNPVEGGDRFYNPNTTSGDSPEAQGTTAKQPNVAALGWLTHMMNKEQTRVTDFLTKGKTHDEIANWYASWQKKLSEVVTQLGGSESIAENHCKANLNFLSKGRKSFDLNGSAQLLLEQIEEEKNDAN